ncbi:hypothetical protein BE04_08065 [Sorangium cellulosum]|uniref:Uncharacterized protein n=1 Tax=Sorangium cellulosum TaxID=56 RepID=A0A150P1U2_SORCE|nr:hypothetical protein BE04_08065 [Sorangium cellulosum]
MNLDQLQAPRADIAHGVSFAALRPQDACRRLAVAIGISAGAAILLWPKAALANIGIPMLIFAWPASWIAFVPVVLVEAAVARRVLRLPTREAIKLSLAANAWSTLAGIPITWALLTVLEMTVAPTLSRARGDLGTAATLLMVPISAPWLGPVKESWRVLAAGAFLCVPFFFASVWIEARSAGRRVPAADALRWAKRANSATYGFFLVALALAALISWMSRAGSAG